MKRGPVVAIVIFVASLCGCPGDASDDEIEPSGTLQFSNAGYLWKESWGDASITVTRKGGAARSASVLVFITGGTATAGVDFPVYIDCVANLHWSDGDASDKVVSLPLFDDALLEGAETVELGLAVALGAAMGPTSYTTLTVVDSENPLSGSLQFASDAISADESSGSAPLTVTRTGGSVGAVSVQIYVMSGSARLGSDVPQWIDFVAELTWPDGDASDRTFDAPIFDDATPEADETVQFVLLYPTGEASLGAPTDTILTILDND